jgi:hypothetical protein
MADAKSVIELGIKLWNAHDRQKFMALVDERVEIECPGGLRLSGTAGWGEFYEVERGVPGQCRRRGRLRYRGPGRRGGTVHRNPHRDPAWSGGRCPADRAES